MNPPEKEQVGVEVVPTIVDCAIDENALPAEVDPPSTSPKFFFPHVESMVDGSKVVLSLP